MRKSLIITGTSKGLGCSLAKTSIKYGYYCYFGASRWGGIDISIEKNVLNWFGNLDILNYEVDKIEKPSLLINNAGICINKSILETSGKEWRKQNDINLNGAFYCSREYIKYCINNKIKGKIVNIASTAGTNARPGRAGYAASKAALISLSLSMSEELKSYGIKVYCICPGAFDTEMRHKIAPDDNFKKMLKPENVANEIFNIVENLNYSDGQIIYIKQ